MEPAPAAGSSDGEGLHVQVGLFDNCVEDAVAGGEDPILPPPGLAQQLYRLAKAGDAATVDALLSGPGGAAISPDGGGEDGFTPLMTAAEAGHDAVVARLLESPSVDPNAKNAYGQTALGFAAQNGRVGCVSLLLGSRKVNPAAATGGKTAADLARAVGFDSMAERVEAAMAAAHDRIEVAALLLPIFKPSQSAATRVGGIDGGSGDAIGATEVRRWTAGADSGPAPQVRPPGELRPMQTSMTVDPGFVKVQEWLRGFGDTLKCDRGPCSPPTTPSPARGSPRCS